jgi:hypothetical protein
MPEETIHGTEPLQTAENWDYGPPTYLTFAQVATTAERVSTLPIADMVDAVDPELVRAAKLYQVGEWNDDDRDYVTYHALRL